MSAVAIDRTGSTAATEMFVLEPIAQRLGLAPVVLVPGSITVGSGPECDLRLDLPGVQEEHCVLNATPGRVSVRALDRRTWQNNLPITESWLHFGDRLVIGPVEFRVRTVEPWDVLPPAAATRPLSPVARTATEDPAADSAESRSHLEANLRRQIADLEASVARHQAAVARLEEQATATETAHSNQTSLPTTLFKIPTIQQAGTTATNVAVPAPPVLDENYQRLLTEIALTHEQTYRKLSDLSVKEDLLQRQFGELDAQWGLLQARMSEQDQTRAEHQQREQQLSSREQLCRQWETELAAREQQFQQDVESTSQWQMQQDADGTRLTQQASLLSDREQTLADGAQQLAARETELQQQIAELEQRQADLNRQEAEIRGRLQELEANSATWTTWQSATEAELSNRAVELETRAAEQKSQADELTRRQHELEESNRQLQQEFQRLDSERARLAARQAELEATTTEHVTRQQAEADHLASQSALLTERERGITELFGEVAEHQAQLEAECASLDQRRTELEQQEAALRRQTEEAETQWNAWQLSQSQSAAELATQLEGVEARSRENDLQAAELAEQAERLASREAELARQHAECEQQQTQLQHKSEQLAAASTQLDVQRRDLEARTTTNDVLSAELTDRKHALELQGAQLQQDQEHLDVERNRLSAWSVELTNWAAELAAEKTGLSRAQDELNAALAELSRVETEIDAFENQLADDANQLTSREASLTAAEVNMAWLEHTWELAALRIRPVPGDTARAEERRTDTLSQIVERLTAERDDLAIELYSQSVTAEAEADDAAIVTHEVELQSTQLHVDREAWQQQIAQLAADQAELLTQRDELRLQQHMLEQARQEQQAKWSDWQAEMATQTNRLHADREALSTRETELNSKWAELAVEQESIDKLNEFLQTRHAELAQLRADLEQKLAEATTQSAQQEPEAESREAEFQQREQELAARSAALAEQESAWQAAQLELQQQRQVAEQEQADWQRYQQSRDDSDQDDPASRALDSISDLDDLVQSELDQDRFAVREDQHLSNWNSSDVSDPAPHYGDVGRQDYHTDAELPTAPEEDLDGSSLRAKLAEMFNLDLSKPATENPDLEGPTESVEEEYTESQEEVIHDIPAPSPVHTSAAVAEPDAEEYDSVESYMQRLLDRNRLSRESLEASQPNRFQLQPVVENKEETSSLRNVVAAPVVESNNVSPEETEPEPERSPTVRAAVDPRKVRAGLMSLRQVANDSARSAIAKSKWNKIRAQLLVQGLLIGACTAVGGIVFVGQWMSLVQSSPWGWVAIGMGLSLAVKIVLDIKSVYEVDYVERPGEGPQAMTVEGDVDQE